MAQQVDRERLSDGDWEIKKGREHKEGAESRSIIIGREDQI
jgi:hypothetical protein